MAICKGVEKSTRFLWKSVIKHLFDGNQVDYPTPLKIFNETKTACNHAVIANRGELEAATPETIPDAMKIIYLKGKI